ncbi:MAG: uracil-DNA glycosylase [Aquificaceae bacterium]
MALREIGFDEVFVFDVSQKPDRCRENLLRLRELYDRMSKERKCVLYSPLEDYVFGEGNPCASVVFVGEAPGEEEVLQKRPFVGKAGKLLDKTLSVAGIKREDVYITNVVKSRPPQNRKPSQKEIQSCVDYLRKEILIIMPKLIVCLGATAVEGIIGRQMSVTKLSKKLFDYPLKSGIKVFVTYHPAYVLRNQGAEADFINDIKTVAELLSNL